MNRVIYRIYRKKKDLDKISPKTEKRYTIERNLRLSNSLRQHEYRAISLEGYIVVLASVSPIDCYRAARSRIASLKKEEDCGGKEKRESIRGGTKSRSVFGRCSRDHARDRAVSNNVSPSPPPPPPSSRRLIET